MEMSIFIAEIISSTDFATQKDKLDHYSLIRISLTMIDGIVMKGKRIIILILLHK